MRQWKMLNTPLNWMTREVFATFKAGTFSSRKTVDLVSEIRVAKIFIRSVVKQDFRFFVFFLLRWLERETKLCFGSKKPSFGSSLISRLRSKSPTSPELLLKLQSSSQRCLFDCFSFECVSRWSDTEVSTIDVFEQKWLRVRRESCQEWCERTQRSTD